MLRQNHWVFPKGRNRLSISLCVLLSACSSVPETQFRTMETSVRLKAPILSDSTLAQINPSHLAQPRKEFSLAQRRSTSNEKPPSSVQKVWGVSVLNRERRDESLQQPASLSSHTIELKQTETLLHQTTKTKDANISRPPLQRPPSCSKMIQGQIIRQLGQYQLLTCKGEQFALDFPNPIYPDLAPLLTMESSRLYAQFWGTHHAAFANQKSHFNVCRLNYISTEIDPCTRGKTWPIANVEPFWSVRALERQLPFYQLGNRQQTSSRLNFKIQPYASIPYVKERKGTLNEKICHDNRLSWQARFHFDQ